MATPAAKPKGKPKPAKLPKKPSKTSTAGSGGQPESGPAAIPSAETISPARARKLRSKELWKTVKEKISQRRKAFLEFNENEIANYEEDSKPWNVHDAYSKWENILDKSKAKRELAVRRLKGKVKRIPNKRNNVTKRRNSEKPGSFVNTWSSENQFVDPDNDFVSLKATKSRNAGWKRFGCKFRDMNRTEKHQMSDYLWALQQRRLAETRRAILDRGLTGYSKNGPMTPFKRGVISADQWREVKDVMEKRRRRAIEQGLFVSPAKTPEERIRRQKISNEIWEKTKRRLGRQQRRCLGVKKPTRPPNQKRKKAISDMTWRQMKKPLERRRRRLLAPKETQRSKKRKDLSYKLWRKYYKELERRQRKILKLTGPTHSLSPQKRKMITNEMLYDLRNHMEKKRRKALESANTYVPRYDENERIYRSAQIWDYIGDRMEMKRRLLLSRGMPREYSTSEYYGSPLFYSLAPLQNPEYRPYYQDYYEEAF